MNVVWVSSVTGSVGGMVRCSEASSGYMEVDKYTLIANAEALASSNVRKPDCYSYVHRITNAGQDSITRIIIPKPDGVSFQGWEANNFS